MIVFFGETALNITEIRVKPLGRRSDRLRAFCSITIDDEFVVHDLRIIEGRQGLFVAMPSRKLTDKCPSCGGKNHLRAAFCNDCGSKLDKGRAREKGKCHVDVAHPIVSSCRDGIMESVLDAYAAQCGDVEADGEGPATDASPKGEEEQDDRDAGETCGNGKQEDDLEDGDEAESSEGREKDTESSTGGEDAVSEDGDGGDGESAPAEDSDAESSRDDSDRRAGSGGFGEGIF